MKILSNIALAILTIFTPVKMAVITVLVLVIADFCTGVSVAAKAKEPITSAGFRRTLVKLFLFETALLLGFMAETFLIGHIFPVCNIISAFIGITEIKSIMENLNTLGGGTLFASLLKRLNSANLDKE